MILSRRSIILSGITVAAAGALPGFAYAAAGTPKRLVFVIQRGAADGLAIVAPTGDPAFAAARRAMADESAGGVKLDAKFTLHPRSEEHTSELQSLMSNSYAVFCLKKKNKT